jgi:mRNA-degrading endonuclease RelE of RelBE toxin-antitoxin system
MSYKVLVSKTFQQKFYQTQKNFQNKIRNSLKELQNDPYSQRLNCDIKPLKDTKPKKHRLRVNDYRIIYIVEQKKIKVIDLIKREIGYNRLD